MSIEWDGKGLPPVETVCGLTCDGVDQGVVTVMYISEQFTVCKNHKYGHEQGARTDRYKFRPISAPEPSAEELRDKAIEELAGEIAGWSNREESTIGQDLLAMYLHDQGYRKQVKP